MKRPGALNSKILVKALEFIWGKGRINLQKNLGNLPEH